MSNKTAEELRAEYAVLIAAAQRPPCTLADTLKVRRLRDELAVALRALDVSTTPATEGPAIAAAFPNAGSGMAVSTGRAAEGPKLAPLDPPLAAGSDGTVAVRQSRPPTVPSNEHLPKQALERSSQVPSSQGVPPYGDEVQGVPPCTLAGALPHAPQPPKAVTRRSRRAASPNFTVRLAPEIRATLETKTAALELTPSAYIRGLIVADLGLAIDEKKAARTRSQNQQLAEFIISNNRIGTLFNQAVAAMNRGQPSPFTRQEIDTLQRQYSSIVNKILKMDFA